MMILRRIFLMGLICWSFSAVAAEEYSSIVDVDITDVSAAVAKDKAMAQANRQALNEVASSFTDDSGLALLNSLSNDQIVYFIKDTTVLEEKSSDVRYIASLKVTIQDNILRQYLEEKGMGGNMELNSIDVMYSYPTLSSWLETERKLKSVKNVDTLETVAMTSGKVQFRLNYTGGFNDLISNMEHKKLGLRQNGNMYILQSILSLGE